MGDGTKLEKILLNVIRNGIKYTKPDGRVKIWIKGEKKEACIFIEDDDIDIPAEDLPCIFERFYRVDKTRSRKEGGSDLGLSTAKWIAEAHYNSINVKSAEGKGTKFIIRLPYNFKERTNKYPV
ncbi:MAG: ATP-binding protein [Patescibacteria group bacterium]|nr:ATP-binding protein [Patescibacteria group bacterium]